MNNALTVDVEDYFQVSAFEEAISRDTWDSIPLRVLDNTLRIIDLFAEYDAKATFFTLGWIAERCPEVVKRIREAGHEVACHGYGHQRIYNLTPQQFREDIHRAKSILEDLTGVPVLGYRAPSYTIVNKTLWALDALIEEGFVYDSSIFPIYHDLYGIPDADPFPHDITRESGTIREFPITTYQTSILGKKLNLPVSGGGYLRLFPVKWIRGAMRSVNRDGHPVVLYFHPWEIDPGQPRVKAKLKSRFRHYVNLTKTHDKIRVLLEAFDFAPMFEVLGVSGEGK